MHGTMHGRLLLLVIVPALLAIVALGATQSRAPTAEAAISAPTNLQVSSIGPGAVRFDWTAGSENVWYCVNTAQSLADLAAGGPSWRNHGCWTTESRLDVSGLGCGVTYFWNVYAWNPSTNATSASVSFQTPSCPSAITPPTGLNATNPAAGVVRFDWDAGQGNVWFCVNTAESFADLATGGPTWRNDGCWSTSSQLDVSTLPCGRSIFWNVYAWNEVSNATSDAAAAQTSSCSSVFSPPDDLEASNITANSAHLTWNAGAGNIWFCVNSAESEADLASGGPTWRNNGCWSTRDSLDLTGLGACKTYYWNVFAWNETRNGTSATATFTTTGCPTPTPTPTPTSTPVA